MAWILFFLAWFCGSSYLYWSRWRMFKYNKAKWDRRKEGLLSFTDTQMIWIIGLLPFTIAVSAMAVTSLALCSGAALVKGWVNPDEY